MRAVVCHELGPPSLLRVEEQPDPGARPGTVVIDVEAAGVNFVDALFVGGRYQIKPPLPFVPGNEVAGRVAAVGDGVDELVVGQRVLANCGLGGYATKVAVPVASVFALPDRLSAPQAATFTQSYSTSLFALRDRAHLADGERVVVLGGGGGVGLAAIGVARGPGCPGPRCGLESREAGGGGRGGGGRGTRPRGDTDQGRRARLGGRHGSRRGGGPGGWASGRTGPTLAG